MHLPNHTQVPNQFIDEAMATLSGSATKVFLAINRKTVGWHKISDAISYSQLKELTGLQNTAIRTALTELEKASLIISTGASGKTTRYDLSFTSPETREDLSGNQRGTSPETRETKETLKETLQKKRPERRVVTIDMSTGKFSGLTDQDYQQWREAFPAVDVKVEERSAGLWCVDNPTKTKRDYHRFLTNWFRRCQERGGTKGYRPPLALSPVRPPSKQEPPLSDADRAANLGMLQNLQRDLANKKKLA